MTRLKPSGERVEADFYPTPTWGARRFMERVGIGLPGGDWLEPAAGAGALIRAANDYRGDVRWWAVDIREEARGPLSAIHPPVPLIVDDFLQLGWARPRRFSVAMSNPPFSLAREFVDACLPIADHVVMLLRLGFYASASRHDLMRATHPDVWVVPDRLAFVGEYADSTEYAWFHWHAEAEGRIRVLDLTPVEERVINTACALELGPDLPLQPSLFGDERSTT